MTAEPRRLRVAVLASCTISGFPELLAENLKAAGIEPEFWIGGYNQYRQELLDPQSAFYCFEPDFALIYADGEDLFAPVLENPFAYDAVRQIDIAREAAGELRELVAGAAQRLNRTAFLLNTVVLPPVHAATGLDYNSAPEISRIASEYNQLLGDFARENRSIAIVDTAAVAAWIGYRQWHDPRLWYLARMRWSRAASRAVAQKYMAAIRATLGASRKCIVLDLDNTLWGGVAGEDGVTGIALGEEGIGLAFVEFQLELLNLHRKGVLLAIASKNNPGDALAVMRSHRTMRIKEEHFAAIRINWDDKASNIRSIAEELNLGLDSFVFIDDNPAERALVRSSLPEVLTPEWPDEPADYRTALLELASLEFPKLRVTEEDQRRGALYRSQAARKQLAAQGGSLEGFYRSLQMTARIGEADALTIPRISQLTQKTNQFNLTTRRYTETEIAALATRDDAVVLWMDLTDRFGANGIVGVLILVKDSDQTWRIDTFLLSCRVIGRTAEQAFLAYACEWLRTRNARRLIGEYRRTPRNAVVERLYPDFDFVAAPRETIGDAERWELDLSSRGVDVPEWIQIVSDQKNAHA
jgi:FkbH-like protein